jgi:transposase
VTKAQVEVITSVQRRLRWSRAEKERIVAAAMEPGAPDREAADAIAVTEFGLTDEQRNRLVLEKV